MNSEHLQEALTVLSRALPQISFDPNQPIAFTKAIVQHLQAQKQQHESDLQVMNERMTESIDRMLWRITELRNELRALQSERRATTQPKSAAELPEAQPILADDARSLGQVAYEAKAHHQFETTALRAPTWEAAESYIKDSHKAMAQAVANVVLTQTVRRMEAIPEQELEDLWYDTPKLASEVRARLIAAARGLPKEEPA